MTGGTGMDGKPILGRIIMPQIIGSHEAEMESKDQVTPEHKRPSVAQLLNRSSLFGWKSIAISLTVAVVMFFLGAMLAAEVLFGLALGCLPVMVAGVQFGLRWYYGRRLKAMLSDKYTLVWSYSDEDWHAFQSAMASELAKSKRSVLERKLVLPAVCLGLLAFGVMFGALLTIDSIEFTPALIFCLVFGFLTAAGIYLALVSKIVMQRYRVRKLSQSVGQAVLGRDGFCFRHWILLWNKSSVQFRGARVAENQGAPDEVILSALLSYRNPISGIGTISSDVFTHYQVPIPTGQGEAAANYVSQRNTG